MWYLSSAKTAKLPRYQQIIQLIEQLLDKGELQVGERLPSERKLAQLLQVNRSTIIRAFDELSDRGLLIRKPNSGTFINQQKWGLQCYPLINWQAPAPTLLTHPKAPYDRAANHLRRLASHFDLSNGDLPSDLAPQLQLPELSWQALIEHEHAGDSAPIGLASLRETVQTYLKQQFKMAINHDEILITSGTQQAIFLITQGLLKPGDAIGIEAPSYFYSLPLFQAVGLRLYAIPMDSDGILIEGLAELMQCQPLKMIFLNPIFQNPTGSIMAPKRKLALLDYCARKHLPIVEDDAYSALSFNTQLDIRPLKHLDHNHQVIYMGSLSKYLGKNIRIGWMVAPKALINKLAHIRQQLDSGLSILPQLLAEHYLNRHFQSHQHQLQAALKSRADNLIAWLEQYHPSQLSFHQPLGGFHLYGHCQDEHSRAQLLQELLNQHIIVAKGEYFGQASHSLRLSYAHFNPEG